MKGELRVTGQEGGRFFYAVQIGHFDVQMFHLDVFQGKIAKAIFSRLIEDGGLLLGVQQTVNQSLQLLSLVGHDGVLEGEIVHVHLKEVGRGDVFDSSSVPSLQKKRRERTDPTLGHFESLPLCLESQRSAYPVNQGVCRGFGREVKERKKITGISFHVDLMPERISISTRPLNNVSFRISKLEAWRISF